MIEKESAEIVKVSKVGVIGDGRFAEAIAYLVAKVNKDVEVVLWTYKEEYVRMVHETGNFRHAEDKKLPSNLKITHSPKEVVEGSEAIFSILSAQKTRAVVEDYFQQLIKENWDKIEVIISGTKGMEEETDMLMSEVWEDIFADENLDVLEKYGVITGLNFASEVIHDSPMVTSFAAKRKEEQKLGRELLNDEGSFYVIPSSDIRGLEIVGAAKNVISIASGAASTLYGDSAAQAIISAGTVEVYNLAMALGAQKSTFDSWGPPIGDLQGSAKSNESRNFQEGVARAKGQKRADTGIAEGVSTVKAIMQMAEQKRIKMPVCNAVLEITKGEEPIEKIVQNLLEEIGRYTGRVARASWMNNKNGNPDNTSFLLK
ncbi:hypothetical protein K9L27_01650 [Candidatus Gracilibacteria bacterium]|nr:hypothetical protein [Candidatus Gracilibacteria bacterium]